MYVHPKTGPFGASNIDNRSKAYLYKKVLTSIKKNDLYELSLDENKKQIIFEKT